MEPDALPLLLPPFLDDHPEAPGEDIWKKFELLASPPGSPLVEEAAHDCRLEPGGLLGNLGAFVLRDCMWSGFSARLEKTRGEKAGAKAPSSPPPPAGAQDPGLAGGECVAPGAVFAWPAGGGGGGGTPAEGKIPTSSGSESPSDSEGEEIDVVTVEKRQSLGVRKPVTITVRADPLDPCMKHFHIAIHQQQHNYAARFPSEGFSCKGTLAKDPQQPPPPLPLPAPLLQEHNGSNGVPQSPGRAVERLPSEPFLPRAGSAPSSDSEDATKRKNHNDLERKRRKDLRSRFLALRDQVPGLATCSKTPKVVVLSQASRYLRSLLQAEEQMVAEKRQLRAHQLQLLNRMSLLQGSP